MTTRTLARHLDLASHSVISRWERGARVPSTEMVSAICIVLSVSGAERDRLVEMARDAADEPANLVSVGSAGEQDQLAALMEYERNATTITAVSPSLMPGLAQTSDYARAIMAGTADTDKMVALRLGRRDVVTRRRSPARYIAFIVESVLHQTVGDRDVQLDQLHYLIELSKLDNVDIRVIPSSAGFTPALAGSFVLLEFAKAAPVVHLEHHRSSACLRDEADVRAYQDAREDIDRVAMNPEDTAELIAEVTSQMETP